MPLLTVNVPFVIVCSTLTPVAPTSQTVPCSDLVKVPSPVRVTVVAPVAGAQKPPAPLDVACSHRIVTDDVYVPRKAPLTVPADVTVQPAAVV